MIKKITALFIACAIAVCASGCNSQTENPPSVTEDTVATTPAQTPDEEKDEVTTEATTVATTTEATTAATTAATTTQKPQTPSEVKSMTAREVAKNMGLGLNLGNTMEAYNATNCEKISYEWIPTIGANTPKDYETCWGAVVTTQEVINGIKASGFDTVRIPVFWGNMMKNDGTYTINEKYIARFLGAGGEDGTVQARHLP